MNRLVHVLILLALFWPGAGWAANVSVSVVGTAQNNAGTDTSHAYTGITVGTCTDCALVCTMGFEQNVSGVSAVWDAVGANQTLTVVNSQKENTWNRYIYIFAVLNPATGNKTLDVTWTTGSNGRVNCAQFDNVLQTSVAAAFVDAANANGNSANPSQAVTTASGDATVGALMASTGPSAETQTLIMRTSSGHGSSTYALSTSASDTHAWTLASTTWGFAGIHIKSTNGAGGGGSSGAMLLRGVGN